MALVTHGLFMKGAAEVIADPAIDQLVVADAVPAFRLASREKQDRHLARAPLLAETIRRLHEDRSLTDLMVF